MKGIGTPENKERAFEVWREYGGRNIPKVLAELKKRHSLKISSATLYQWKREGDWEGRMKNADARKSEVEVEGLTFQERMFRDLIMRKRAYDRYFEGKPIDHQAQYAYNAIVKTLFDLSKDIKPEDAKDPEEMKRLTDEILRAEYGLDR